VAAEYLITCVGKADRPAGHKHIVKVGIGTGQHTVAAIYGFMDDGNAFRTASPTTGQIVAVAKYKCPCGVETLRSHADKQWNDNLDNLPRCP
jgi:hypothetical protein